VWPRSLRGERGLGAVLRVGCAMTRCVVVVVSVLGILGVLGVLMVFTLLAVLIVLTHSIRSHASCSCSSDSVFACIIVSLGRRVHT
jgi:hypothetical protein